MSPTPEPLTTAQATFDPVGGGAISGSQSLTRSVGPVSTTDLPSSEMIEGQISPWLELGVFAWQYIHAQEFRMAQEDRIRKSAIDPVHFQPAIDHYTKTEHYLKGQLEKTFKRLMPAEIIALTDENGIGPASLGRLLGITGDPADRTLRQFLAYCGHGDPTRRRRIGMSKLELAACGNGAAKRATWNIARSVKMSKHHGGKYKDLYYARKEATQDRLHTAPCLRCGPRGKPAQEGSPWSLAHMDEDAMRIVGKAVLKDIWQAARDAK